VSGVEEYSMIGSIGAKGALVKSLKSVYMYLYLQATISSRMNGKKGWRDAGKKIWEQY
jgi:hypothetical protein